MKKFSFLIVLIICLFASSVQAKTIKVVALKDFSTANPSPTFQVKTVEEEIFKNGAILEEGTIISGILLKVEKPKRGKRNAYFDFIPTSISYKGQEKKIEGKIVAKVVAYRPIDPEKTAIYVARKATNLIFKGASMGIAFVQGAVAAEDGERVKTGFISAYKDSPLAYFEIGSELNIKIGDTLVLELKKIR